jgi:SAM-dependent methyltransferase
MPLDWIDVNHLSFNTLLLLERVQLSWFPGWVSEEELAIALQGNPAVEWYLRHKCPEISSWLDHCLSAFTFSTPPNAERIRQAEINILNSINDLAVYVVDPAIYDAQPFLGWDSDELRNLADFSGKVVIDIGSGTGRLAFIAAENALAVYAVEPVGNLRLYIKQKTQAKNITNIYPTDGLITDLPFHAGFADITMCGHVFGASPEQEYCEMKRVTKPGGMVILCPGTSPSETHPHEYLLSQGFSWSTFEEPRDGTKRKYWKRME